jgi:cell division protein ZapD
MADSLLYEFPCNEKVRTYLRLEALFRRYDWLCAQDSGIAHQSAISALFDLLDASARSDLRNDLIQELERHRQRLLRLSGSDEVDQEKLSATLKSISDAIEEVAGNVGRTSQSVRGDPWLQLVRARLNLAGGTCEFDLPQFHRWLNSPAESRRRELMGYVETLEPVRHACDLLLRLMRSNAQVEEFTATNGSFQYSMHRKPQYALAQIRMPADSPYLPEMSANKYMLWIRFSVEDEHHRLCATHDTVKFSLGLCSLL